jgi:hypothetical protein
MTDLPAHIPPALKFLPIAGLVVASVIHLMPVAGVLGLFMLWAVAVPPLRLAALLVGLASAASFLLVARWVGGYNTAIGRVVTADVVATAALAAGLAAELLLAARRGP